MRKREIEKLLYHAVARALGVEPRESPPPRPTGNARILKATRSPAENRHQAAA